MNTVHSVAVVWYVYLLRMMGEVTIDMTGKGSRLLYVGMTNHPARRLSNHNSGQVQSTQGRQWEMIALAGCASRADAALLEKWLKIGDSRKKRICFAEAFPFGGGGNTRMQEEIWLKAKESIERRKKGKS